MLGDLGNVNHKIYADRACNCAKLVTLVKNFINIWFAIGRLNKYILYAEGLSKGTQAIQSIKWNEMYKWKDDMKYPRYEPELVYAQD